MDHATFWPLYLKAHRSAKNRRLHALGTLGYLALLAWILASGQWGWAWAMPVWAYGCAWIGHFCLEKNSPATFRHPVRSFVSDHRMVALMLTGRLEAEFARLGIQGMA